MAARAGAEGRAQRVVREQRRDRARQLGRCAPLDEDAGLSVDDELGRSADARRDDGSSRRQRLEDHAAQRVGNHRRHDDDLGQRVERQDVTVGQRIEPSHVRVRRVELSFADEQEERVGKLTDDPRHRRDEVGRPLTGRELPDVEDDPAAPQPETVAQRLDLPGRGRHRGRRNVVDGLDAPYPVEEAGAPIDIEDPLAHTDDAVDTPQEALLHARVQPKVEEGELRAKLAARILHVEREVLL